MFKKLLYNYRMRKLRKHYIDLLYKYNSHLDYKDLEMMCDYILRGLHK